LPPTSLIVAEPTAEGGHRYGQFVRFLLVGGSNTLVTLALFVLLQRWLSPAAAYTVVFVLGLGYTTAMTATVVFGARLTWRTAAAFVGWYLLVYGVGLLVVQLLQTFWEPSSLVTAVVTVGVTAPLNFVGGRLLFAVRRPASLPG
jgi:putative flippase GtrA